MDGLGSVDRVEGVVFVDDSVGASGFVNVFQHYLTGLEGAVAETNFQEFEHAGLQIDISLLKTLCGLN